MTGVIAYVNRAHRYYMAEVRLHDRFVLRECFKF